MINEDKKEELDEEKKGEENEEINKEIKEETKEENNEETKEKQEGQEQNEEIEKENTEEIDKNPQETVDDNQKEATEEEKEVKEETEKEKLDEQNEEDNNEKQEEEQVKPEEENNQEEIEKENQEKTEEEKQQNDENAEDGENGEENNDKKESQDGQLDEQNNEGNEGQEQEENNESIDKNKEGEQKNEDNANEEEENNNEEKNDEDQENNVEKSNDEEKSINEDNNNNEETNNNEEKKTNEENEINEEKDITKEGETQEEMKDNQNQSNNEEKTENKIETPKEEEKIENQENNQEKKEETIENDNININEIKEKKEKEEEKIHPLKRVSCLPKSSTFQNLIWQLEKKKEEQMKKEPPKKINKIDMNKYQSLIGNKFIGQMSKKPNELMKKNDEHRDSITSNNDNVPPHEVTPNQKEEKTPYEDINELKRKSVFQKGAINFGFEIFEGFSNTMRVKSEAILFKDNSLLETFLTSKKYDNYLSELKKEGIKESNRETFCEGFFIASFPKVDGKVIENSEQRMLASCGHEECSKLPSMKPQIIMRYPLKDTKNLELNNLAATICFPTGIKVCYSENDYPRKIGDYVTQITNQKGERYYMRTFHFYHKMSNVDLPREYNMHPVKHHLMKVTDKYSVLNEKELTDDIINGVQRNLQFCETLGFREYVYIPYCLALISKYSYEKELKICLETIFKIMAQEPDKLKFEINELIMYLIHSIPIPIKNMKVRFYIPYNKTGIELSCPKIDDVSTVNSKLTVLFKYLSVDTIILIFRLLLSEKKILFFHDDYTELTVYLDSFISLLYPFKWVHTYIPIMSDQMLKYLETFLPFLNGIHTSLKKFVEDVFREGEIEESDEVFLIYIRENKVDLSSSLNNKKGKSKLTKYVQKNVLPLPFEKELKKELKKIESNYKSLIKDPKKDMTPLENDMRDAFLNFFVKILYDYEKYVGIIDDDVIFNKVLFMNNLSKDKEFYDEFIDCQLFQQFTQNLIQNECSYFNKKIREAKEKELEKKDKKKKKDKGKKEQVKINDQIYIATPDYLGVKKNDKKVIEKAVNGIEFVTSNEEEVRRGILEKINPIDDKKYDNSKCIIYLTPEKKADVKKEDEKKNQLQASLLLKIKNNKSDKSENELNEKQKDKIKDDIKDTVIKIFKSKIEEDYKNLKIETSRLLENSFGREFFVSLISNNNNNIISLQEYSFNFLSDMIKCILNTVLKLEETDEIIKEVVLLIKSTKFFEKEVQVQNKRYSKIEQKITLYEALKKNIQSYNKICQTSLWQKWYELDLKKQEEPDNNEVKESIVMNICSEIIDLEIQKTTVKKIIDSINKIIYVEDSEPYLNFQQHYLKEITNSKYISKY